MLQNHQPPIVTVPLRTAVSYHWLNSITYSYGLSLYSTPQLPSPPLSSSLLAQICTNFAFYCLAARTATYACCRINLQRATSSPNVFAFVTIYWHRRALNKVFKCMHVHLRIKLSWRCQPCHYSCSCCCRYYFDFSCWDWDAI